MLRLDLCDYSVVYVVEKRRITAKDTNAANRRNKLIFRNNALFRSGI